VTASSPSSESDRGGKDSASAVDGVDLVHTLLGLNSLEFDSTKRPPELEGLRLSLRTKVPWDILLIHDALVAAEKRSIAPRFANACTECSGEVLSHGTRNESLECSSNVRIVAHCCMVDRQTSSHAKGIYHFE